MAPVSARCTVLLCALTCRCLTLIAATLQVATPAPTPPQSPSVPKAPTTPEPAKRPAAVAQASPACPASLVCDAISEHSTPQVRSHGLSRHSKL